jgi:GNAT superfamily N-acetyltransferase
MKKVLGGREIMDYKIISVRENPEFLEKSIDYFTIKFGIERRIYEDCIKYSITTDSNMPRWYLMLLGDEIVGGYGLIANDFVSRQDLFPYFCALYVEEKYRGKELGAKLQLHGRKEANKLGFNKIYLCTDHIGYYEKYGWTHIGTGYHPWGEESRLYEIHTQD